jgi:hypothetical protein
MLFRARSPEVIAIFLSAIVILQTGAVVRAATTSGPALGTAFIRVNQIGYEVGEAKNAVLLSNGSESGATFSLVNSSSGIAVFNGTVGTTIGSWSSSYADTYALNFSSFDGPGSYFLRVQTPIAAISPTFMVGTGEQLYERALANALFFYLVQQDGPNVDPSVMGRQPSHITDEQASVYSPPTYVNDILQGSLKQIGGPVNASGGWFDAGDYIKFVETASYATAIMLFAVREYPGMLSGNATDFRSEAKSELGWLLQMWNETTETLYYQVGIGDGNSNIDGDHDLWRLPQADDKLNVSAGNAEYFIKYRPVFEAGPPGSLVSPNLAGRLAADFGLCFQVLYLQDPTLADQCLYAGETVYGLANTTEPVVSSSLLTTSPYDYYPETSWEDDMELGATELCLATQLGHLPPSLQHTDPMYYLRSAANWSHAYMTGAEDGTDTLNLYDVSGLAHYELFQAITQAGNPALAVTKAALMSDLAQQLLQGTQAAAKDPFGSGVAYNSGEDWVPHEFGFFLEANFYDQLAKVLTYQTFGLDQLNLVLGENAWGSSFVVGDGSVFPNCMQHQIANLAGSLNGTSPMALGATVDGPTVLSNLNGLGTVAGMRTCPAAGGDPFKAFDGKGAGYMDNVVAWPTVEPADDYTALTIVAFAMQVASSPAPLTVKLAANPSSITLQNSTTLTALVAGGTGSYPLYSWSGLPPGCLGSNSASILCTPASVGHYNVTVTVNDSAGHSATATAMVTVTPSVGVLAITSFNANPESIALGQTSNFSVSASGGTQPYAYAYAGLPKGCSSANASTLSCDPLSAGNYSVRVFVNDTVGKSVSATTPLTVTNASGPTLTSVEVSPASSTVAQSGTQPFTAIPKCTVACPSGTTYSWALANSLGSLGAYAGTTVTFTAGSVAGEETLFVNATLNGKTVEGSATITVSSMQAATLLSVAVDPATASVASGGSQSFTAIPTCTAICPTGTSYSWSLTSVLGALNSTAGPSVDFTAGSYAGNVAVFVNATLNGITKSSAAGIVIYGSLAYTLTNVMINPTSVTMRVGDSETFTATPTCALGKCPDGLGFQWLVNRTLGTLESGNSSTAVFVAGAPGVFSLEVQVRYQPLSTNFVSNVTVVTIIPSGSGNSNVLGLPPADAYVLFVSLGIAIVAVVVAVALRRKGKERDPLRGSPGVSGTDGPNVDGETVNPPPSSYGSAGPPVEET